MLVAGGGSAPCSVGVLPSGSAKKPSACGEQVAERLRRTTGRHGRGRACASPQLHVGHPVAKKVSLPFTAPDYTDSYQATINTNQGKITFNLLEQQGHLHRQLVRPTWRRRSYASTTPSATGC